MAEPTAPPTGNRLVPLLVLVVTTALILGGIWLVRGQTDTAEGAMSEVTVSGAAGPAPKVGEAATDFTGLTVADDTVKLSDYAGKPVWLMFNATWCASCRAENPDVQAAYAARGGDVEVLAVYLGETAREVTPYAEKLGLTYTHIVDPTTQLSSQYQVRGVPMHFFIGADGVVKSMHAGILNAAQIDEELAALSLS